jgi:lysine 2,3-aminomutase
MDINKRIIRNFWKKNPIVFGILKESPSPDIARDHLHNYLSEKWKILYRKVEEEDAPALEWDIQMAALRTFRRIISVRSEKLAKFSIVELLLNIAKEQYDKVPISLKRGFFVEMDHILNAMAGKSIVYGKEKTPAFLKASGRRAANLRSRALNEISQYCMRHISKYPHGLMEKVKNRRTRNRTRILKKLGGTAEDWQNYKWHLKNVVRDCKTLNKLIHLSPDEAKAIKLAKEIRLPFGITPYYVSLMDNETSRKNDHAIRAQVLPPMDYVESMKKYRGDQEYCADFMLERDTSPVDLITRRYPYIAIIKPFNTCSQICVYCQRNWEIQDVLDKKALSPKKSLDKAFKWFEKNPEIQEILITGGDPFIMSTSRIKSLLFRISRMPHIHRIRFGSRTPVVLPQRVTQDLVDTISAFHIPGKREIALVTHFEHVYEITPDAMKAVQRFREKGISIYNQAVFTLENSRKFELVALRRLLRLIGVDSYYAFNTKGKEETRNYRVPMARLQQEVKEEARLMPGLVRTDEPVYNVPKLGKNYIRAEQHHSLLTFLPDGRRVYEFHPWEKNLSLAKTFIDTDVSIYDYVQALKRRGEDINDYKSIWYYY